MKVVAFNGSPRKNGNTYETIRAVADELEKEAIEVEMIHVGNKLIQGCLACGKCFKTKDEKCSNSKDPVNEWIQKMKEADGIILGAPTHFSGIPGTMKSFLDRAFYVATANKGLFRHKVGASITAVRRSGGVPTFDQLNHFLNYSEMLIPTSNYWNVAYGAAPGEALQDAEGMQIMNILGKNMAWLLKLVDNGKDTVKENENEKKTFTNFIR